MKEQVTVVGAGSWGTAIANLLGEKSYTTSLWVRSKGVEESINLGQENTKYLPGIKISTHVKAFTDLEEAVRGSRIIFLVVPAQVIRKIAKELAKILPSSVMVINAAKGIEVDSLYRMSQILQEEFPKELAANIGIISGPNHAEEVSRGIPSATVVASHKRQVAQFVQEVLFTPAFRVYTNPDIIGVELGGALKNIIAIAAGASDGLGFGDNTKSALMTRGLAEIARLGKALGASPLTFAGLSGMGDLITTCTSKHSRNRRVGMELAQEKNLEEIMRGMNDMVAEGVPTTKAAYQLAERHEVELPITEAVYNVIFNKQSTKEAVGQLMGRGATYEEEILNDIWR